MSKNQRSIPVGVSDFKKLIDGDYAYVDKTLFIEELVERGVEVALIPRPRRFGKTLNLSMLRYFFEKTEQDTSYLFQPFKVWQNEKCRALQGQFPVIFITLKDVKDGSWEETFDSLKELISQAIRAHPYLLKDSVLDDREKKLYQEMADEQGDPRFYKRSLYLLTEWLYRYHKQKVILLIDEYDAPAHTAYVKGFYEELISFLRNWLSAGLKDNSFLEMGVLTGILRIAKESIFSGLNNVTTYTILDSQFQDKFGLTEPEVRTLLQEYQMLDHWDDVRKWYNGYKIGSCEGIYNPWSVLSCIGKEGKLATYWVNTSDNALIQQLIAQGSEEIKEDLEILLKGASIEKRVKEGLVFADLNSSDVVWSLLLFSGYLSLVQTVVSEDQPCQLRIPNREVEKLYQSIILYWFEKTIDSSQYQKLLDSLTKGDIVTFSKIFEDFLLSSLSFLDVPVSASEKVYHAFVLGLLVGLKDRYEVKSNRESGYGRYDVMLIPHNSQELGFVIEFKKVDPAEDQDLESTVTSALKQIAERQYDQELKDRGVNRILHLGFAFHGKKVLIRSQNPSKDI